MPTGKVRARNVANLPATNQRVERFQGLFYRRQFVETVHVVDVDHRLSECATETSQHRSARRPDEISFSWKSTSPVVFRDSFAQDLFRQTVGINVRCVEEVDASVQANSKQTPSAAISGETR